MTKIQKKEKNFFNTIIIGAGAAGLFFAAQPRISGDFLILEKTKNPATKLLMSGAGQCNLTHSGSMQEFLLCYGKNGKRIRTCLYKHNNKELCNFFKALDVPLKERQDGKIFPASMDAKQVSNALLNTISKKGITIQYQKNITALQKTAEGYTITTDNTTYTTKHLVIATGGCSYPSTGSDGSIFEILQKDLDIKITPRMPALCPVYVEGYPFSELSGISIKNVQIKTANEKREGDLLFTHKNFSGPVILNHSRYMKAGQSLAINYVFPYTISSMIAQLKEDLPGNNKLLETYLSETYDLPKRFCDTVVEITGLKRRKISSLGGKEINVISQMLSQATYKISGLGSFKEAMVTSGGVSLDEVNLNTMESKLHAGLYFIGEVLDIDGDTGGYNLQFCYSSATAAAKHIVNNHV